MSNHARRGRGGGWTPPPPRRLRSGSALVLAVVLLAVGGFSLAVGIGIHVTTTPIRGGVTTEATVVAVYHHPGVKDDYYVPTLRFTDRAGTVHTFRGDQSGKVSVGDRIALSYDPDDPSRNHELDNGHRWLFGVVIGAVLLGLGLLTLSRAFRRRRGRAGRPA